MDSYQRAAVLVAAASLAGGIMIPAHAEASGGRLTVRLQGLPAKAQLATTPRLTVTGPTTAMKARSWKLTQNTTLKGLRPGTYVVRSRAVRTNQGKILKPQGPYEWFTVKAGKSTTARVKFVGPVPGRDAGANSIDLNRACRTMFADTYASGYRDIDDPLSVYCYDRQGVQHDHHGIDLSAYCRVRYDNSSNYAFLKGQPYPKVNDWWCQLYK